MARAAVSRSSEAEDLSLSQAAELLLEECRMVLPGIQTLFGFQLIAVFNSSFTERLTAGEQRLHLVAISLIVLATALIMTPAATHRQVSPERLTRAFITTSTRLLLWSMFPLAVGVCLDFYLIARLILGHGALVPLITAGMFAVFVVLWFLLPRVKGLRAVLGGEG